MVGNLYERSVKSILENFTNIAEELLVKWDVTLTRFLKEAIKHVDYSLPQECIKDFKKTVANFTCSSFQRSEIAFAGFGENEYHAHCRSFRVDAVIQNKLVYKSSRQDGISVNRSAVIIPFAQQEEIRSFLDGISPKLWELLLGGLEQAIGSTGYFPDKTIELIEKIVPLENGQKISVLDQLKNACGGYLNTVLNDIHNARWQIHTNPIIETVQFLNKDELVQMAETLVNLESFRKKMSSEPETVGGPIDIAVITKGDGFIWSKRKHYFQPELNHQFFKNYFHHTYANSQEK